MKLNFKYKNPGELPIYKFKQFKDITDDKTTYDLQKELSVLAILCDVSEDEIYKMTPDEVREYIIKMHDNINDYNNKINENFHKHRPKNLELNGRKYKVDYNINKLNMAQYIDFQMYIVNVKDKIDVLHKMLSVFIIPAGHKYGEEYDMNQVIDDISTLKVEQALTINFFLKKRSVNLILNKLFSIRMIMMTMKWRIKDPALKEEMKKTITEIKKQEKILKEM